MGKKRISKQDLLTSGMIHNFNNLMGVIVSQATALSRRAKDGLFLKECDLIRKAAMDAAQYINRFGQPKDCLGKEEWVDINEILSEVVEMTKPQWAPYKFSLRLNTVPKIYACALSLKEVFINLILNAVEALREKERGSIQALTYAENNLVKIMISDSGIGMSKSAIRKAFKPFFSTKSDRGRGLGLSTSYDIIKKFRGSLSVESTKDVGTTFTMTFPISKPDQKKVIQAKKIMLVDDEEDYRQATAELLKMEGYQVDQAASGSEALELLKSKTYDVVLSDVRMPKLSGPDLARKVKDLHKNTRVVLISGNNDLGHVSESIDGWIRKPCMIEDIREAIEKTCH